MISYGKNAYSSNSLKNKNFNFFFTQVDRNFLYPRVSSKFLYSCPIISYKQIIYIYFFCFLKFQKFQHKFKVLIIIIKTFVSYRGINVLLIQMLKTMIEISKFNLTKRTSFFTVQNLGIPLLFLPRRLGPLKVEN